MLLLRASKYAYPNIEGFLSFSEVFPINVGPIFGDLNWQRHVFFN